MEVKALVLKSQYHDSVALMLVAKRVRELPGVQDAAAVMGTAANKGLLDQAGLTTKETQAALPDDLVVVVKCAGKADEVLEQARAFLERKTSTVEPSRQEITSVRGAARVFPGANAAVISVAGAYAAREAREALAAGLHVLLFSDNVSLQDEIAVKKFALSRGLLLMGPGAGTAIINGIGLGFANQVPRGPVGIVSAAGTGLQEVSTLLAKQGMGVSQAIGTGGRDLHAEVGGLTAAAGIRALTEDKNTQVIVLVGKPADPGVMDRLVKLLDGSRKECVVCLLGAEIADKGKGKIHFCDTLEECAFTAGALASGKSFDYAGEMDKQIKELSGEAEKIRANLSPNQRGLRGLFSGGTLCYEAQVILKKMLAEPVYSNAPLDKSNLWRDKSSSPDYLLLDLGEEEYTLGRPHPMIDNDLRVRMIRQESSHPQTAVMLLDVVIGYGAHPDPAAELGKAIEKAREAAASEKHSIAFITSVTGTRADPQGLDATTEKLEKAGLIVCRTNAQAARLAGLILREIDP